MRGAAFYPSPIKAAVKRASQTGQRYCDRHAAEAQPLRGRGDDGGRMARSPQLAGRTLGGASIRQRPHAHAVAQRRSCAARADIQRRSAVGAQLMHQLLGIRSARKTPELHGPASSPLQRGSALGRSGPRTCGGHPRNGGRWRSFKRRVCGLLCAQRGDFAVAGRGACGGRFRRCRCPTHSGRNRRR